MRSKKQRILELEKLVSDLRRDLDRWRVEYYNDSAPSQSDEVYDALVMDLREAEYRLNRLKDLGRRDDISRVGAVPVQGLKHVRHVVPMLSLDNVFRIEEFLNFEVSLKKKLGLKGSLRYVAEPKYDGVAISLTYENGVLTLAATRGDGLTGEDVTENVRLISDIPFHLDVLNVPKLLVVRGELLMLKSEFRRINLERASKSLLPSSSPRNLANGTIKALRSFEDRRLNFFAYQIVFPDQDTQLKSIELLKGWGFSVYEEILIANNFSEVESIYESLESKRSGLDYEIDGVVFKLNDLEMARKVGNRANSPRHSIAFKFRAVEAITQIQSIEFQVGRTGILTPIAHVRPVLLSGIRIRRVNLNNMEWIKDKGIKVHDFVNVRRTGDVIPQVTQVVLDRRPDCAFSPETPSVCPVCMSKVAMYKNAGLRCTGDFNCSAQLVARLLHFVSKGAMNLKGWGVKAISELVSKNAIRNPADIYELDLDNIYDGDVLRYQTIGSKVAENMKKSREDSKKQSLARFIYALGINGVGERGAYLLEDRYKTLDRIREATVDDLKEHMHDLVAEQIYFYFRAPQNLRWLDRLLKFSRSWQSKVENKFCYGRRYVLDMLDGKVKERIKRFILDQGGAVEDLLNEKIYALITDRVDLYLAGGVRDEERTKLLDLVVKALENRYFKFLVLIVRRSGFIPRSLHLKRLSKFYSLTKFKSAEVYRRFSTKRAEIKKYDIEILRASEFLDQSARVCSSKIFQGENIAVTGTISKLSRRELVEILQLHGASVKNSVNNKTDCLIVGTNPGEVKVRAAVSHNVKMIDENELMQKLSMIMV